MAYTNLYHPILEYADAVWDPTLAKYIESLEMLRHKALRFIAELKDKKVLPRHALSLAFSLSNRDAGLTDLISL